GAKTIFDTDSGKTLKYLKSITGNKYKVHDLRTMYGSALADHHVNRLRKKGIKGDLLKKRVGYIVSQHLGHNALTLKESKEKVMSQEEARKKRAQKNGKKFKPLSDDKIKEKTLNLLQRSRDSATDMSLKNYIHPDIFKG